MMRINLLPIKAARRHDTAKQELAILAGIAVIVIASLVGWYLSVDSEIDGLKQRVRKANAELTAVKKDVARVEEFKKKAEALEKKLGVIESLKTNRVGPAKVLDELATIFTEQRKVWLKRVAEKDGKLTLEGYAMEYANVSELEAALAKRAPMFSNISLGGPIKSVRPKAGLQHFEWVLTCDVKIEGS